MTKGIHKKTIYAVDYYLDLDDKPFQKEKKKQYVYAKVIQIIILYRSSKELIFFYSSLKILRITDEYKIKMFHSPQHALRFFFSHKSPYNGWIPRRTTRERKSKYHQKRDIPLTNNEFFIYKQNTPCRSQIFYRPCTNPVCQYINRIPPTTNIFKNRYSRWTLPTIVQLHWINSCRKES